MDNAGEGWSDHPTPPENQRDELCVKQGMDGFAHVKFEAHRREVSDGEEHNGYVEDGLNG
jgi:hypothetical protein